MAVSSLSDEKFRACWADEGCTLYGVGTVVAGEGEQGRICTASRGVAVCTRTIFTVPFSLAPFLPFRSVRVDG